MNEHAPWIELDSFEISQFLDKVYDEDFAPLLTGRAFELRKKKLRFFDGYEHFVLSNKSMLPHFNLDFLSNGQDVLYMDGSEHPLELLVQRGCLKLTKDNILEYLSFFSLAAFYPNRKVKFIIDPKKSPYSGPSAMGHHFNILKYHSNTMVEYSEAEQCFFITIPVLYNGETVKGFVQVSHDGEIHIKQPVHVPLMDKSRDHAPLLYSHPYEHDLLEQNLDILRISDTGAQLLNGYLNRRDKLTIMSGVEHGFIAPHEGIAFVIAPQNMDTYSPYQLFDIIAALKDLELQSEGYDRGDPFNQEGQYIRLNTVYNLEIVEILCKIVTELEQSDFSEVPLKFRRLGYDKIYGAYKHGEDKETLYNILLNTVYEE